jgi:hypothetical protein
MHLDGGRGDIKDVVLLPKILSYRDGGVSLKNMVYAKFVSMFDGGIDGH